MALTGKQKRYLRAQAHDLTPAHSVGKNGVSETWLTDVLQVLNKRELIKINLQQSATETPATVTDYVTTHSDIAVVQTIGRTMVLYCEAPEQKYRRVSLQVAKLA